MRVCFVMLEEGHFQPAFPLARALRNKGCEVTFLPWAVKNRLRQIQSVADREGYHTFNLTETLGPDEVLWSPEFIKKTMSGERDHWFKELPVDIFVVDNIHLHFLMFVFQRCGKPSLRFKISPDGWNADGGVPTHQTYRPKEIFFRPQPAWAKKWRETQRRVVWAGARFGLRCFGPRPWMTSADDHNAMGAIILCAFSLPWPAAIRKLATDIGYRGPIVWPGSWPVFQWKTICGYPRGFDVGVTPSSNSYYLGLHCDDQWVPPTDFPWEKLRADKPLVYLGLGRHSRDSASRVMPVFESLAAVAGELPDVDFVWANPKTTTTTLPSNLICTPFAPQLQLLKRASVAIIHGGISSILECVATGTPMITVPTRDFDDRPSNAARAEFLGLSETLYPPAKVTLSNMRVALSTLLEPDAPHRSAIARFAEESRMEDDIERLCTDMQRIANNEMAPW